MKKDLHSLIIIIILKLHLMIHTAKTESVNLFKIKINTQYASYATNKISVKNATLTLDIFCLRHDILTAT